MSVLQIHLILIHWNITYEMQCLTYINVTHQSRSTLTYGCEERCASNLGWLVSRPKLMQQYCFSAKGSRHAKSIRWTFRTCCLNWRNLPGNLPGAAAAEPNTSELMRPEGQANWLVHEIAHLHLSHSVETILESIHSGTVNSTLLQIIPPINIPLRKKAP